MNCLPPFQLLVAATASSLGGRLGKKIGLFMFYISLQILIFQVRTPYHVSVLKLALLQYAKAVGYFSFNTTSCLRIHGLVEAYLVCGGS